LSIFENFKLFIKSAMHCNSAVVSMLRSFIPNEQHSLAADAHEALLFYFIR